MRRACLTLVSLLAVLATAKCLAQTAEEFSTQQLPSVDQTMPPQNPGPACEVLITDAPGGLDGSAEISPAASPSDFMGNRYFDQSPPSQNPCPALAEMPITGKTINLDGSEETAKVVSLSDFWGYRYSSDALAWIPGGGNQFGMFSIAWDHYQPSGINHGLGIGMGFYFLSGPEQTEMPPRVYDFSIAYQIRHRLGPLAFDIAAGVRAASDFEGSAREGIRYPGHAVGFLNVRPTLDLVFGVDYLDRGDIKLLPVAGLIWVPNPNMRFELVFPRPRAVFQMSENYRIYVAGELGGGTWAIEREIIGDDLATYRDLRVSLGLEYVQKDGHRSAFEVSYLFDRRLEYTSNIGDMHLDDAVMLRLVTTY
jgi:hypothetical protein